MSATDFSPRLLNNRYGSAFLALFLIVIAPLFVCSPVTSDVSLFDIQALTVLRGGVLYRDILEPNLPGIVWIHLGIRSLVGWSSEAIRAFDLLVFAASLLVFARIVSFAAVRKRFAPSLAFMLAACWFYLTRNEWCHCQRDIWMMLPVGLAILQRLRRLRRLQHLKPGGTPAVAEGILWGVAFWIKPHVALPAIAAIVTSRRLCDSWKQWITDSLFVVAGGVVAGVPGIAWLIKTGAWPHFWEMLLQWNPEYVSIGQQRQDWTKVWFMYQRFYPWWVVHLLAVPLSLRTLITTLTAATPRRSSQITEFANALLMAAVYLTWLIQSHLLQHAMDYIHVPEYLLGMMVIASHNWRLEVEVRRVAFAAFLLLAAFTSPHFRPNHLAVWPRCFAEGSSSEVRAVLAQGNMPDWKHLHDVRRFLASNNVRDRDITCLNGHSVHLFKELHVLPATRYWCVTHPLTLFPSHHDEIMNAITNSGHRFVVVDDFESSHPNQILPQRFPNDFPVVYRSGPYAVHAVTEKHPPKTVYSTKSIQR